MKRMHDHPPRLARDLDTLLRQAHRRDVLRLLGAASLLPFFGCGTGTDALAAGGADGGSSGTGTDGGTSGSCTSIRLGGDCNLLTLLRCKCTFLQKARAHT